MRRLLVVAALFFALPTLAQVSPPKAGGSSGPAFPTVNVRNSTYGAKGDGVANDTAALQAAATTVISAGHGSIYVPAGNYSIFSPMIVNSSGLERLRIFGDGAASTIDGMSQQIPLILIHPGWPALSTTAPLAPCACGFGHNFTDDHGWITLSDISGVNVDGASAFTVEGWFKPNSVAGPNVIIGASGAKSLGSTRLRPFFVMSNSGALRGHLETSDSPTGVNVNGGSMTAGQTYYFAMTYDGAHLNLYLNGTRVDQQVLTGTVVQPLYTDINIGPQFIGWRYAKLADNGPNGTVSNIEISKTARWTASSISVPSAPTLDSNAVVYFSFEGANDITFLARNPGLNAMVVEHRDDLATAMTEIEIDHLHLTRAMSGVDINTGINTHVHDIVMESISKDGIVLRNNSFYNTIKNIHATGMAKGSMIAVLNSGLTEISSVFLIGGFVDIFGLAFGGSITNAYTTPALGGLYDVWLQGGGATDTNAVINYGAFGNESGHYSEAALCLDSMGAVVVNGVNFESASAPQPTAYIVVDRGDLLAPDTAFPVKISGASFKSGGASSVPLNRISARGNWTGTRMLLENYFDFSTASAPAALCDVAGAVALDTYSQRTNLVGISSTDTKANNLRAQCTVADASTACVWNFAVAEPNASYFAVCASSSVTGSPAADSAVILSQTKATGSDTFNLKAAPGAGTSRTFDCIMVR
jgi:hypothetical protein